MVLGNHQSSFLLSFFFSSIQLYAMGGDAFIPGRGSLGLVDQDHWPNHLIFPLPPVKSSHFNNVVAISRDSGQ